MRLLLSIVALLHFLCMPAFGSTIDRDTLVYSWSSNVGPLNPHLYSPNQMFAQAMVYEPLVRYGEGGKILPWLAESWKISPDGKVYTFTLKTNVRFSDGTPFDARAVKMNFDALVKNCSNHDWLEVIAQIKETEAVDSHTFRLHLKNSYYPVLQELCLVRPLRFLSPKAFPDNLDTAKGIKAPVGTGPWQLVESKKGEYDLFTVNENYWGTKPSFKRLLIKVIGDANARAVAFETGEIDLIYGAGGHSSGQIGLDAFVRFQNDPDLVSKISTPIATRAIAINTKRFPTNDLAIRTALLHGIDKPALVQHIFLGVEKQAETLFSPDLPYCDLGLLPFEYDTKKAAALLDAAGWHLAATGPYREKDGRELMLDFCFIGNDALQKSVAEAIQGDLKKIGIHLRLVGEESDSFLTRQKNGEFGMIFGDTWGAPYDPHSFCSSMRVASHADYQAQLGLPMKAELDKKIGEVLITVNESARQNAFRDILSTLHEQAVYLPLTYMTGIMVHKKELTNVRFGPTKNEIPFETMVRE
jgi:nickel transport system substrate-binding protein